MSDQQDNAKPGFFARLKAGLSKSAGALENVAGIFTNRKLDAESVADLEDALVRVDLGAGLSHRVAQAIAQGRYDMNIAPYDLRILLSKEIGRILKPSEKPLVVDRTKQPFVVLVAGVNGTGKTTTIGKIANRLRKDGLKIVMAAGDTFRAAAIEQLQVWGERTGSEVIAREAGGDAAGLAFDALARAREQKADVLLIDTAGRLQNKAGLMAELEKIVRVIKKLDATAPHAVLLVLDATTGQNGLRQARVFAEVVDITGIVLTKLDGTAKGGIVIAVQRELGVPVKLVGLGEGPDDLAPFDPATFVDALIG